jgi:hypothetical protein
VAGVVVTASGFGLYSGCRLRQVFVCHLSQ